MNCPWIDELVTQIRVFPASTEEQIALVSLANDLAEANDGHLDWPKPHLGRMRLMPGIAFSSVAVVPKHLVFCIEDPDARTRVAIYTVHYQNDTLEYVFRNPNLRELLRRFATYATP